MNKTYDVAIVGGGVVGLTLALMLAKAHFKVLVIERNTQPISSSPPIDFRVSAINLASHAVFEALDVWSPLALRAGIFEQITVFEPVNKKVDSKKEAIKYSYELNFDSSLIQKPYLGFILSHSAISQVLTESLLDYSVEIWYEAEVESLQNEGEKTVIALKTGEKLKAQLVVGADGKHSNLRDLMGVVAKEKNYQQTAIVAQVRTEKIHQKTAWQCFRDEGPLAFLPLQDENNCSIVWSTIPEKAEALLHLSEEKFTQNLEAAFESRLGEVQLQSPRFSFPLKMRYTTPFVKQGCALIGDAVHTIHPLAGQGLNLGLLDAACLAEMLQEARDKSINLGDYAVLRRYERWRKTQHVILIKTMDIFKQSFSLNVFPFPLLRGKVIQQLNHWDYFKRINMRYATGLIGDLPKIACNLE